MTNLESLYWSEEFSDAELHAIADACVIQQTEPLYLTYAEWIKKINRKILEQNELNWFDNNRDTQW